MLDTILSLIAPHSCCSCGELGAILCEVCKNDIIYDQFGRCIGCMKPTAGSLCGACRQSSGIAEAWCVGERNGALKQVLDEYKFRSSKAVAGVLVELLHNTLPLLDQGAVFVPVPTAPGHVRVRGFDHTKLLVQGLAERCALPWQQVLEQTSNDIQHFKTRADRFRAAQQSLRSKGPAPEHVILVDDIMTTGATLYTCAATLREAGSKRVDVALVARQVLD